MNHLRGLLTDHMHANQFQVVAAEEEFQEAIPVANDPAPRGLVIAGAPDDEGEALLPERLRRLAHHAHFGKGVNAVRQQL